MSTRKILPMAAQLQRQEVASINPTLSLIFW